MARFTVFLTWIGIGMNLISGTSAQASLPIVGIQSGKGSDGSVPQRLEIRQLMQNVPQWNLYILALKHLEQYTDQGDRSSYYQIAGIHGRPYTTWDGSEIMGRPQAGYCTHAMTLFPMWHRPYVALYEQVLYGWVQTIASEAPFAGRPEYAAAAASFRVPYWDWAQTPPSGQGDLPTAISGSEYIVIDLPNATYPVLNPFYQYKFHPLSANDFPNALFDQWQTTMRDPTTQDASASSNDNAVEGQLTNAQASYRATLMNLFQQDTSFGPFSNTAWNPGQPNQYNSIEALHNNLHNTIGSGGHMSFPDYAAFDPIFWLHHANIDRAIAIWQALYPNSFVPSSTAGSGTYSIRAGQTIDQNTPLAPFHKDANHNYWTSASVRSTSTFGYTYPELQFWKSSSPAAYTTAVKQAVNSLYSASGITLRRRTAKSQKPVPESPSMGTHIASGFGDNLKDLKTDTDKAADDNTYREWIANVRVAKHALEGSFNVFIFLGDFNSDPTAWPTDPNLVGMHSVFARNMTMDKDIIVTGTVPLSDALHKDAVAGKVDDNDISAVEAYFTQKLHWKVAKVDKTAVSASEVNALKVSVVSSPVTPAERDDEFPTWGEFQVHTDVTNNRAGGLNHGDQT